jgi:hypothetical protein
MPKRIQNRWSLSPLLYVLAGELLQYVVNFAWHNGDLELPLNQYFGLDYPIIQYLRFFKETFFLVMHRAKPSLKEDMQQWLDTL